MTAYWLILLHSSIRLKKVMILYFVSLHITIQCYKTFCLNFKENTNIFLLNFLFLNKYTRLFIALKSIFFINHTVMFLNNVLF